MKASIRDITEENIKEIPKPCKSCLYWENPAIKQGRELSQIEKVKYEAEKAAWFLKTLEEFGNCGKILYVDSKPAGYSQYSTTNRLPNIQEYGAKKLGTAKENVVFISCLYISDENFRGKGLGKGLLDKVVADLKKRSFKAVETFARKGSADNPSGSIELYLRKGFYVKEEINSDFALVRLNL
jgi:ribosomal protein S18 acetylase RimI-like enzyme